MIVEPKPDTLVWQDGELIAWSSATMHLSDHHYGFGVFEGVRAYGGERGTHVFRLGDHTRRLLRSAHILKLDLPPAFDESVLNEAQLEVVRRNGLEDAYIRPFIFNSGFLGLSPRSRGLRVRVAVMALQWRDDGAFTSEQAAAGGISLRTSTYTQHHSSSLLTKAKANGNYMTGVLAREEARECGADDAMLLDRDGFVTETSAANLFALRRGVLCTPPLDSVLEGVTRDTVLSLARSMEVQVQECRLTRDDIYTADEVFLTGTAAELTSVWQVDGRQIGNGTRGPLTRRLQTAYTDLVRGRSGAHPNWLTRI